MDTVSHGVAGKTLFGTDTKDAWRQAVDFLKDSAEVMNGRETGLVGGVGNAVPGGEEEASLVEAEAKKVIARGGFQVAMEESGEAGGMDAAVAGDFGHGDGLAVIEGKISAGFLERIPAERGVLAFLVYAEYLENEGGDSCRDGLAPAPTPHLPFFDNGLKAGFVILPIGVGSWVEPKSGQVREGSAGGLEFNGQVPKFSYPRSGKGVIDAGRDEDDGPTGERK